MTSACGSEPQRAFAPRLAKEGPARRAGVVKLLRQVALLQSQRGRVRLQGRTIFGSGSELVTFAGVDYNAINDCTWVNPMASITIRNLDEQTKARLRVRAAHRKRSMEDEVRNILRAALAEDAATPRNLAEAIRRRFKALGGVELRLAAREPMREPPKPGK